MEANQMKTNEQKQKIEDKNKEKKEEPAKLTLVEKPKPATEKERRSYWHYSEMNKHRMLKSVDEIQVGKVYPYVGWFKSNVISHYLVVSKNEGTTDSFVLYCVYD